MNVISKMSIAFPGKNVTQFNKEVKVSTDSIDSNQLIQLYETTFDNDVLIKRSGLGLTVIIKDKV